MKIYFGKIDNFYFKLLLLGGYEFFFCKIDNFYFSMYINRLFGKFDY